jgi:hypothetical protein
MEPRDQIASPPTRLDTSKLTLRQWCLVVNQQWPEASDAEYPELISRLQGGRKFDKIIEQHYKDLDSCSRN